MSSSSGYRVLTVTRLNTKQILLYLLSINIFVWADLSGLCIYFEGVGGISTYNTVSNLTVTTDVFIASVNLKNKQLVSVKIYLLSKDNLTWIIGLPIVECSTIFVT